MQANHQIQFRTTKLYPQILFPCFFVCVQLSFLMLYLDYKVCGDGVIFCFWVCMRQFSRALVCSRCSFISVIKDNDTVGHPHRMELRELCLLCCCRHWAGDSCFFLALSDVISWRWIYAVQPESPPQLYRGFALQITKISSILRWVLQCMLHSCSNKALVVKDLGW